MTIESHFPKRYGGAALRDIFLPIRRYDQSPLYVVLRHYRFQTVDFPLAVAVVQLATNLNRRKCSTFLNDEIVFFLAPSGLGPPMVFTPTACRPASTSE